MIILFLATSTIVYAGTMNVSTKYGYYKWNGEIISKYELNPGNYPLSDGISYIEVQNESSLNSITVNNDAWQQYINSVK